MRAFAVGEVEKRLLAEGGGYEVVHAAPGIEVGVYVLVAPAPDDQKPHEDDEIYVVLRGNGAIVVDRERVPLEQGQAIFVEALAEHRFVDYESMSLIVVFTPAADAAAPLRRSTYA